VILPATYQNGFAPRDGQPLYPSLWKGCCGAWNPGLGPTGLTLRDNSGFSNHGTLTNGPTFAASQGKYAMSFDGTDDYITAGTGFWTRVGSFSSFSFSLWFKSDGKSNCGLIGTGTSDFGVFSIYSNVPTNLRFLIGSTSNLLDATITSGAWYHVAATYDGSVARLFLDGVQKSSMIVSGSFSNSGKPLYLGAYYDPAFCWDGCMDFISAYSRALSPDEIRTLATRRGIAYEMAPRRRSSSALAVTSYSTFRPSVLRGSR